MDIAGLPSDILVEVTASIATRSATPLVDIVNLRQSCKVCSEEGRAVHGHTAAASGTFTMPWSTAYMIGMITLHDSSSPEQALLERLEWRFSAPSSSAGPSWIASVRREAVSVIRRLSMRRWRVEHEPPTPLRILGAACWRLLGRRGEEVLLQPDVLVGGNKSSASLSRTFNRLR